MTAPVVAAWLRSNPRGAPLVWALLGFLPFVLGPWHLFVAPYSTPAWPGYVKGWEVSFLDAIAVGVLFATRGQRQKTVLMLPFLAYIFAVTIAIYQAQFAKLAFSYVFQLLRMFILFLAVSRVVVSERGAKAVFAGLVAGLAVQAVYAILARAGGAIQTGGSLGHQNLLGFVSHMVLLPAFGVFLAGRWPRLAILGVSSGLIAVILTASRASIAFSALGLALTLLLSLSMRFTGRKAALGGVALLLFAGSYPLAKASLDRRFQDRQSTFFAEDKEREAFSKAAHAMLADHPMGVGPNHYVVVANTQGYSERAGVAWRSTSRGTNVHNSYLLAAVETGYFGALTMVFLLGSALWLAFTTAFRYRRQPGAEMLIGVGCGIIAISLHMMFEWIFVIYPSQYIFAVSLGLIAGLRSRFVSKARQASTARRAPNTSDDSSEARESGAMAWRSTSAG
jgi:O-antigen ligase